MTFHKERQLDFMTLQAWKMKFFDFKTFQVFLDLYKPCGYFSLTCISLPVLLRMIAWLRTLKNSLIPLTSVEVKKHLTSRFPLIYPLYQNTLPLTI